MKRITIVYDMPTQKNVGLSDTCNVRFPLRRYKKANGTAPKGNDFKSIVAQAGESAALAAAVERIVPKDMWTSKLST